MTRNKSIDIAKGIGISLVLLGHLLPETFFLRKVIYSFHMPLFFMVAGMVMKPHPLKELFKKRVNSLLIPYVLWAVIFAGFSFKTMVFILYGTNKTLTLAGSNGMLWFLMSMFVASLLSGGGKRLK